MAEGSIDPKEDTIMVKGDEDDRDDWPEIGPQNPAESRHYWEQVDEIFMNVTSLLEDDQKDALRKMVKSFKKLPAPTQTLVSS